MKLERRELTDTGGYAFLHRRVPLYGKDGPDVRSRRYNYVIAPRYDVAGEEIEVDSGMALIRLPLDACLSDPAFGPIDASKPPAPKS